MNATDQKLKEILQSGVRDTITSITKYPFAKVIRVDLKSETEEPISWFIYNGRTNGFSQVDLSGARSEDIGIDCIGKDYCFKDCECNCVTDLGYV